jgi:hypothetical protein
VFFDQVRWVAVIDRHLPLGLSRLDLSPSGVDLIFGHALVRVCNLGSPRWDTLQDWMDRSVFIVSSNWNRFDSESCRIYLDASQVNWRELPYNTQIPSRARSLIVIVVFGVSS